LSYDSPFILAFHSFAIFCVKNVNVDYFFIIMRKIEFFLVKFTIS